MKIAIVTGAAGLVGSQAAIRLVDEGFQVVGIDNNARETYFGAEASTEWRRKELEATLQGYTHHHVDVRDQPRMEDLFRDYGSRIALVIHAAAQPAHDWAAQAPRVDFSVNANATLGLLDVTRRWSPEATFIYTSTNKVYGDHPNRLPLLETDTRWELDSRHPQAEHGITEMMSVDQTTHSLFGASKLAADVLVQEYGRYFGMNTVCFRCGCITGGAHASTAQHGFLSYVVRCAVSGAPYTIFGYKGKQVRDNLHVDDLVGMFLSFHRNPRPGEVYNAGGGRARSCSVVEAIVLAEGVTGRRLEVAYSDHNRRADHKWWITDTQKFRAHYPDWSCRYDLNGMLFEMRESLSRRASRDSQ